MPTFPTLCPPRSIRRTVSWAFRALIALTTISSSPAFQESRSVNPSNPSTLEDFKAGDANREPYQRATDLLAALQVSRGDWVADIGAGAGYYSIGMADMVGQEGRVFAEDISNSAMGWLNARVKAFDLRNVEVVKGEAEVPNFPSI